MNRGFSDEELAKFFSVIDNGKHLLCFQLQAFLGLRISEAVIVRLENIDFKQKTIRIFAPKTGSIDFLPLHDKISEILASWVRRYSNDIQEFGGYLVFSDRHYSRKTIPLHLSRGYMRKVFKDVTAVVIAHRISTIQEMDKIIVMDAGGIVEEGTFHQLIARKGLFHELWEKQKCEAPAFFWYACHSQKFSSITSDFLCFHWWLFMQGRLMMYHGSN